MVSVLNGVQRSSIAAGREFIARQALELKPIEKLKYKIKTKSPTEFRPPEPKLIENCSRLFQCQALLAAILLLAAGLFQAVYSGLDDFFKSLAISESLVLSSINWTLVIFGFILLLSCLASVPSKVIL